MGGDLVLDVDHLITPATLESIQVAEEPGSSQEISCVRDEAPTCSSSALPMDSGDKSVKADGLVPEEEEPLIQSGECRICQEEDHVNNLEVPCACSGSLKVCLSSYHFLSGDCIEEIFWKCLCVCNSRLTMIEKIFWLIYLCIFGCEKGFDFVVINI